MAALGGFSGCGAPAQHRSIIRDHLEIALSEKVGAPVVCGPRRLEGIVLPSKVVCRVGGGAKEAVAVRNDGCYEFRHTTYCDVEVRPAE